MRTLWARRFMALAELVAGWSKDPRHKGGCCAGKGPYGGGYRLQTDSQRAYQIARYCCTIETKSTPGLCMPR